jgi:hypothetical protein
MPTEMPNQVPPPRAIGEITVQRQAGHHWPNAPPVAPVHFLVLAFQRRVPISRPFRSFLPTTILPSSIRQRNFDRAQPNALSYSYSAKRYSVQRYSYSIDRALAIMANNPVSHSESIGRKESRFVSSRSTSTGLRPEYEYELMPERDIDPAQSSNDNLRSDPPN